MNKHLQFINLANEIADFCDEYHHNCKDNCYYFNPQTGICPFKKVTGKYPFEWWNRQTEGE